MGREHPVLQRERTLAVVLGASEWPYCPEFQGSPSFQRSAREIADYLRGRDGLNLPARNVKVLIDSFDEAPGILRELWDFVRRRRAEMADLGTPATDLLLYYVGHGGFADNDTFFLTIRSTNEDDPLGTSITAESLGRLIREAAAGLRTYLVLDCCFAASMTKVFMSGGPIGVAVVQLRDALPPQGDAAATRSGKVPSYGTALLCASGPREPAKAPADLSHTMFTGGLLQVLREGDPSAPEWLSLDDVQRIVRARLEARFADRAVLPQVHAPQQRMGRVDLVPLFRNPARFVPAAPPEEPGTDTTSAVDPPPQPPPPDDPHLDTASAEAGSAIEQPPPPTAWWRRSRLVPTIVVVALGIAVSFAIFPRPEPTRETPASLEKTAPVTVASQAPNPVPAAASNPVPTAISPKPRVESDGLQKAQAFASAVPCALLDIREMERRTAVVSGVMLDRNVTELLSRLRELGGFEQIATELTSLDPDQCPVIQAVGDLVRRTRERDGLRLTVLPDTMTSGSQFMFGLPGIHDGAVYVDLYGPDASVLHLARHAVPPGGVGDTVQVQAIMPSIAGKHLLVAIVSPAPLELSNRPQNERLSVYLPVLQRELARLPGSARVEIAVLTAVVPTPPNTVQVQTKPVPPAQTVRSPGLDPRCKNIRERAELGEALSDAERATLATACRKS